MAQLKDLLVAGDSRFLGKVYGDITGNADTATKWANAVNIIVDLAKTSALSLQGGEDTSVNNLTIGLTGYLGVAQGGTGRNTLDSGKALIGNGTDAVSLRTITNNTSATAAAQNTNLITSNTLYYALPTLNGSKSYTSSSTYFAPTSAGTKDYVLTSSGSSTSAPTWISQSSLAVGMASTLSTARYIDGVAFDGSADITHYGVCSTAADTDAKTVTVGTNFKLETGARITVKFTNNNTVADPTLNVNSTGAKPLYRYGNTPMSTDDDVSGWMAGAVMSLVYDGTGWIREFWDNDNTTYTITSVWCNTAKDVAAKTFSNAKYYTETAGNIFEMTLRYANTKNTKLTLNGKDLWIDGKVSGADNYNLPAGKYMVYFDGTKYHISTKGTIPEQWIQLAGLTVPLKGSIDDAQLREALKLTKAMRFIGVSTVTVDPETTTDPGINGYNVTTNRWSGDVIIDKTSKRELVWTIEGKWALLGVDNIGDYKVLQKSEVSVGGHGLPWVITKIKQTINGDISADLGELQTLTINGKTFNSSANVDVGTIGVGYGGTGRTTLTKYGLLLGNAADGINALSPVSAGQVLIAKGTSANPAWDSTLLVESGYGVKVSGYVLLDNTAKFQYNNTDKCVDLIFI